MLIEIIVSGENGRKTKKNNSSENVKKNEHILCEKKTNFYSLELATLNFITNILLSHSLKTSILLCFYVIMTINFVNSH